MIRNMLRNIPNKGPLAAVPLAFRASCHTIGEMVEELECDLQRRWGTGRT
jgi:hypothetical protein